MTTAEIIPVLIKAMLIPALGEKIIPVTIAKIPPDPGTVLNVNITELSLWAIAVVWKSCAYQTMLFSLNPVI